jgi:phage gp16-like protein
VQVIEESKQGAFMTAQVADPSLRREQMAVALRNSKRRLVLSKKRWDLAMG